MAYQNERFTSEDRIKYGLDELDKKYNRTFLPMSRGPDFTIDRERESYLRFVKMGREPEGEAGIFYFSFLYEGFVYTLKFRIESEGEHKKWLHRKYFLLESDIFTKKPLTEPAKQALKEALLEFKGSGILSNQAIFTAEFDF